MRDDFIVRVASELALVGLTSRGGFNFDPGESAPGRALILVGHGGAGYWPHFSQWRRENAGADNPFDSWSRLVIDQVAEALGARSAYPNEQPYPPFQRWAMRAEGLRPSPLGILMHPVYGLWHAYRGALIFDHEIPIQAIQASNHLCDACVGKPCLNSCPVDAFSIDGYAVERCRAHVRCDGGVCRMAGCIARNSCPHDAWRYPAEVQAFHMAAFV